MDVTASHLLSDTHSQVFEVCLSHDHQFVPSDAWEVAGLKRADSRKPLPFMHPVWLET